MTDPASRAALRQSLSALMLGIFAQRNPMDPLEWAEENRRIINQDGNIVPQKWDYAPYTREMYSAIFDPSVKRVVFRMFSRGLKSTVAETALGYFLHQKPCRSLVMYPTITQAEGFSKENLMAQMVEISPELDRLIGNKAGRRLKDNTILNKKAPNGARITICGANVPGDLRRAKGKVLYADEIDAIFGNKSDEGDALKIFAKRAAEYADAVEIYASYPSYKGTSAIDRFYDESDARQFHVDCERCGKAWVMNRERDLRYDPGKEEGARIQCPHCQERHDDHARARMAAAGKWIATKPFRGTAGFWANSLLWPHPVNYDRYPGGYLQILATEWEAAQKSADPDRAIRVFVNTNDAESHTPAGASAPEVESLVSRRAAYDPSADNPELPDGGLVITAGVDVQKTWLETTVVAWGANRKSWGLRHVEIRGRYDSDDTWARWLEFLESQVYGSVPLLNQRSTYPKVFVDCRKWTEEVLARLAPLASRGIFGIMGMPTLSAPIVGKSRVYSSPRAQIYPLGVNAAKGQIYRDLLVDDPAKDGFCAFPDSAEFSRDYFERLTCEDGIDEYYQGELYTRFENTRRMRNEPLDTRVYAMAACVALNPNWALLEAKRKKGKGEKPEGRDYVIAPRDW